MHTETATHAKQHFGALLDKVQKEPVLIEKSGRKVAVLLAYEEYEALQALDDAYWLARADAAHSEGYIGTKASAQLLKEMLHAKD